MTVVIGTRYDGRPCRQRRKFVRGSDRRRSPARARMVRSAAMLMRERGIHGVGLREVVTHSGGPRGSLGRYFPGGKTQLMTEAIDVALADLYDELDRALTEAETFPEAIGVIVAPWRRLLVDHDFALGLSPRRDRRRRRRKRRPPRPRQRPARPVASLSRRRLRQVRRSAGRSRRAFDGAPGCARGRPHPRPRPTQHRTARHRGALLCVTSSRPAANANVSKLHGNRRAGDPEFL